jgi:hypothetical protein
VRPEGIGKLKKRIRIKENMSDGKNIEGGKLKNLEHKKCKKENKMI